MGGNVFLFSLLLFLPCIQCSRILFLPMPQGKSHRASMYPFAKTLADRGHDVHIFSEVVQDKVAAPEGVTETLFQLANVPQEQMDFWVHGNSSAYKKMLWEGRMSPALIIMPWIGTSQQCKTLLRDHRDEFMRMFNQKWDLILVDSLFSNCGIAFASLHYKVRVVPRTL